MTSAHLKVLFAVAILALGAVMLWIAVSSSRRSAPPPPETESSERASPEAPAPHPHLLTSAEMTFDARPTEATVDEVAEDAAERLIDLAESSLEGAASLDSARLYALAGAYERHLAAILSGDRDRWLAFIDSTGAAWASDADRPTREDVAAAQAFRLAPISIADLALRPLHLAGEEVEHPFFAGGRLRPRLRGPYPAPADLASERIDVYEVILPAQVSSPRDSADGQKLNLAIAYWWSRERSRWIPFDMTAYKDGGATTVSFFF